MCHKFINETDKIQLIYSILNEFADMLLPNQISLH